MIKKTKDKELWELIQKGLAKKSMERDTVLAL